MIILVVGMHRSGTSLVARGLHAMGVNLGNGVDTDPHPANPHGHWEHSEVWKAQERLLTRFGREWFSSPGPLPARWLEWPDTVATIDHFTTIASAELAVHGHWLVKDPRSSLLIPLWREVARRLGAELRILRILRGADAVAGSLAARNGMSRELAVRIWTDHQRSIERDSEGLVAQTFLHDAILQQPLAAFAAMGALCGLSDAADRAPAAAALVDPALWHHRPPAGPDGLRGTEPEAAVTAAAGKVVNLGCVLVVMRTRWRLHMLPRGIRSVLSQTYPHWFLQIVNDGGPAHLVEGEVAPYRHLLAGRLSILHHQRQYGMEAASNAGIAAGPGGFIAIHDDDDSWSPEFLERMVSWLHSTGQMVAVSRSRLVAEAWDGGEYVRRQIREFGPTIDRITAADLAPSNLFPPISFLFRRCVYDEVGPFHEGLPALGDWHFNRRVAARHVIGVLQESLAFWHRREQPDRMPNSPLLDHWRAEEFVKAWPDPSPLPEFFSQARQVRIWGSQAGLAGFRHLSPAQRITGSAAAPALPAGLYLIRFPFEGTSGKAFHYRTKASFTRPQSVPLVARPGEEATVLINAQEPILDLGIADAGEVHPLPAVSEAVRLADPLRSLEEFAARPRLPDLLCIGAQRACTTWLHAMLQRHPQVWAGGLKEFHHFDWDESNPTIGEFRQRQALAMVIGAGTDAPDDSDRDQRIRMALRHGFAPANGWDSYAATFESAPPDRLACDFTPAYATLGDETVAEIARVIPGIKVIFILRDPVTRAVSGGLHQLQWAGVERPTEVQLQEACESVANVLRTDYLRTLAIWERHLHADRLLVLFYDDIARDPEAVVARTCAFLGIAEPRAETSRRAAELAPRNSSERSLPWSALARVKVGLSRRWLPMLIELERRYGEPVGQWRLAAELRIQAAETAEAGGGASLDHSVRNNLAQWDMRDPWIRDGDGWDGQSRACGVPNDEWKAGLMERYLPLCPPAGTILEIGSGHGRWSELLVGRAGMLVLL